MNKPLDPADTIRGGVHTDQRHDSAHKHVTGLAEYTDDITEPVGTLHAYLGLSDRAHAEIEDAVVDRLQRHVLAGMGLIVLHSGHFSRLFRRLMGSVAQSERPSARRLTR